MCGELPAASGYSPLLLSGWPGWKSSKLARLYEKYGFHPAGIRRRYYSDNNEDAIIMWTDRLRDRSVRDRIAKLRATLDERT